MSALQPDERAVRSRRRHAWCKTPSCHWAVASTQVNPAGQQGDPVFAAAIAHYREAGHDVVVEKTTTVQYLQPAVVR